MPTKQPNSSKVRSMLHEYASEFSSTTKDKLFCKFCDCLVKSDKRFMFGCFQVDCRKQSLLVEALEIC